MKGVFITFEGSEGCGKSTQSRMLFAFLKEKGYPVLYLREPGGTAISEKIREILLDTRNDGMSQECEMLLYMAARAQVVSEVIAPALKKGSIVICDRFLDSTLAYQGFGLGLDKDFIRSVGKFVTRALSPDITILLDLPVEKGLKHREAKEDRIEKRSYRYHRAVRRGYLSLARAQPKRIKVVKVANNKSITQQRIQDLVSSYLESVRYGL